MKYRLLFLSIVAFFVSLLFFTGSPAQATTTTVDPTNPCGVTGWYVNPDETSDAPTRSTDGFFFDNKDLIHHATEPIDLPDIKKTTGSFVASNPGKVVFKMETENPYSTIVQQPDGKFWSTAMTYDQTGGQGHPVENVSDLVGTDEDPRPTKPGKAEYSAKSHVVTFGVGYWVADGNTTVTSISFHGTKYDLTCKPGATKSPTTPATVSPSQTSHGATTGPGVVDKGHPNSGGSLPVTGSSTTFYVVSGILLVLTGGLISLVVADRRRKTRFIP